MKTSLVLLSVFIAFACNSGGSKSNNKLIGKWKMESFYADIGDGQQHWQPADKNPQRTIEFKENGAYTDSENDTLTTYVMKDNTHIDIKSKNGRHSYNITIVELTDKRLHVRADCIEGCGEKYVRIK